MGITVILENMMLTQLADEGPERWPEIWSIDQSRIRILMLCRRKERPLLEVHGDMIDHDHPVFGIFFRPRETAKLLKELDFDPRSASFQFLDIATTDLGKWVQHLITNDGWVRSMTEISPVPMRLRIGLTRAFEGYSIPCFRHPDLPPLEQLHLPMPAESLVGKAFVSIPRLGAEELATRRGAEILARAGTVSTHSETRIHTPVAENIPIPQVKSKTDETPHSPAISASEVSANQYSQQPGVAPMVSALADSSEPKDDAESEDEVAAEDIDGFSEELLAKVTHSAGRGRSLEMEQPSVQDVSKVSLPDTSDAELTNAEEDDAQGDVGDSVDYTDELPAEEETTEIELVFPELDTEFKGSGPDEKGAESTGKISPPPSPPSGLPSGPPSPPSPPSRPPSEPPSGPPSEPPSGPPSPPSRPPTAPPSSEESPIGEFRKVVTGLLANGVPATEIMDNPEFQKVSEVATAAGVDTWSIFLEISGAA